MTTTEQKKLIIAPNQGAFLEALHTMPQPYNGELSFFADGILPGRSQDADFVFACARRGVIPGSIALSYSKNTDIIKNAGQGHWEVEHDPTSFMHFSGYESSAMANTHINMAIRGGRIHQFDVDVGLKGFEPLRNDLLGQLVANGYHIGHGEFVYSLWHNHQDRGSGKYDATRLCFNATSGLELKLFSQQDHLTEEWKGAASRNFFEVWFEKLAAKYDKKD